MPSKFGDYGDPRQLFVEGFLPDPMTSFDTPTVTIRDELGRVVFKVEIKWAANFFHNIVVNSELNKVILNQFLVINRTHLVLNQSFN